MGREATAWRPAADGCSLLVRVRLTPNASAEEVGGIEATKDGPALRVRVRAIPKGGKANAALEGLLANRFGMAKSAVSVRSGHRSRVKLVVLAGDRDVLMALLGAAAVPAGSARGKQQ